MARPAEVLDADVIAAGESLLAQGKRVNGWALRETIGRGKPDRLMSIWIEHLNSHAAASAPDQAPASSLPAQVEAVASEMQARLASMCSAAWIAVYSEMDRAIAARHQAERDELAAVRLLCEEEMAGAHAAIAAADNTADELAQEIQALQASLASAREERVRLEERLHVQAETFHQELARLARSNDDLSVRAATATDAVATLRQERAVAVAEAEMAKQEALRLTDEVSVLRTEVANIRSKLEDAHLEVGSSRGRLLSAETRLADRDAEVSGMRSMVGNLHHEVHYLVAMLIPALDHLLPHAPSVVDGILDPHTQDGMLARRIITKRADPDFHAPALGRLGLMDVPDSFDEAAAGGVYIRAGFDHDYSEAEVANTVVAKGGASGRNEVLLLESAPARRRRGKK